MRNHHAIEIESFPIAEIQQQITLNFIALAAFIAAIALSNTLKCDRAIVYNNSDSSVKNSLLIRASYLGEPS